MDIDNELERLLKEIQQGLTSYGQAITNEQQLFTTLELDLLYELTRDARNALLEEEKEVKHGSWAEAIIKLDKKMTDLFNNRK